MVNLSLKISLWLLARLLSLSVYLSLPHVPCEELLTGLMMVESTLPGVP